jgi:carboxymethylenebutenolidase
MGTPPWPAILLAHEVFGLVDHIEDVARRFARLGYLTLVPDLYSHDPLRQGLSEWDIEQALRLGRAPDLDAALEELPAERRDGARRAIAWRGQRNQSTYLADLQAVLEFLRTSPTVRADAIAAVGFCMGGGLVGELAAAGAPLAAAVIYYGPPPPLAQVAAVRCPVLGHYGGADPPITSRVPEFEAAMRSHGKAFTAHIYDRAPHAFNNDTRPSFDPPVARLAWRRTRDFLRRALR